MAYAVDEQLLSHNRPGTPLEPQGIVIHATDTPGATAQNEHDYFNSGDRQASAHYFVDWAEIIRTIPENERAWHAGPTANSRFLSVEMCEPGGIDQSWKFDRIWQHTVWLVADACVRYGWNTENNVFSHRGISAMYHETDHTDPIQFLAEYGKKWDDLLVAIDAEIVNIKGAQNTVEKAILIFGSDDLPTARRLQNKIGNCAIFFRNADATAPADVKAAKQLFIVGGKEDGSDIDHPNKVPLAGANWFKTADKVADYLA